MGLVVVYGGYFGCYVNWVRKVCWVVIGFLVVNMLLIMVIRLVLVLMMGLILFGVSLLIVICGMFSVVFCCSRLVWVWLVVILVVVGKNVLKVM